MRRLTPIVSLFGFQAFPLKSTFSSRPIFNEVLLALLKLVAGAKAEAPEMAVAARMAVIFMVMVCSLVGVKEK